MAENVLARPTSPSGVFGDARMHSAALGCAVITEADDMSVAISFRRHRKCRHNSGPSAEIRGLADRPAGPEKAITGLARASSPSESIPTRIIGGIKSQQAQTVQQIGGFPDGAVKH